MLILSLLWEFNTRNLGIYGQFIFVIVLVTYFHRSSVNRCVFFKMDGPTINIKLTLESVSSSSLKDLLEIQIWMPETSNSVTFSDCFMYSYRNNNFNYNVKWFVTQHLSIKYKINNEAKTLLNVLSCLF